MSGEDKVQLGASPSLPNPLGYTTTTTSSIISLDPYSGGGVSKPKPSPRIISYRECLKNHAASIGGNVTDGCGEFMPSGDDGTLEALKCAACNCHRNFHRREHHAELPSHSHSRWSPMPMVKMAFVGSDSSSEELNFNATFSANANAMPLPPHKKRFRTKFSTEQKDKMLQFADKLGWRIPREDDTEVQRFCAEVGVKRQVFKVWMHNNKTSSKKTHDHHHHPQQF